MFFHRFVVVLFYCSNTALALGCKLQSISPFRLETKASDQSFNASVADFHTDWKGRDVEATDQLNGEEIVHHRKTDGPNLDGIPINYDFHNFSNRAIENSAEHRVVKALRLPNAASTAAADSTTCFCRCFQLDEIEIVHKVFESMETDTIFAHCENAHTIRVWSDDSTTGFGQCTQRLTAYHITLGPSVTDLGAVLCPQPFHLFCQLLDSLSRDKIGGHADKAIETVGLTILHELTHPRALVEELLISDIYTESPLDTSRSNAHGNLKACGPYPSVLAYKKKIPGIHNAENFTLLVVESFFVRQHGIPAFQDPPPSPSETFRPARLIRTHEKQPSEGWIQPPVGVHASAETSTSVSKRIHSNPIGPFRLPGPGWPQNWLFLNFPSENVFILDAVIIGLIDTWRLATAALESLSAGMSVSYHRYFQPSDYCDVKDLFNGILQEASIPFTKPPPRGLREWKIYYNDNTLPGPQCHEQKVYAYFVETVNFENPTIVVCPAQFEILPRVLDHIQCHDIGTSASEEALDNIGATLLHEMLHDYGMTGDVANVYADDVEFEVEFVNPDGSKFTKFEMGYGPFWSNYVNLAQHAGSSNVDNFVWFAIEAYFSQKCGIQFGDPAMAPADGTRHPARSLKQFGFGPKPRVG